MESTNNNNVVKYDNLLSNKSDKWAFMQNSLIVVICYHAQYFTSVGFLDIFH